MRIHFIFVVYIIRSEPYQHRVDKGIYHIMQVHDIMCLSTFYLTYFPVWANPSTKYIINTPKSEYKMNSSAI